MPDKHLTTSPAGPGGADSLSDRMRGEWDRRIAHDYRYWMSDGAESDAAMWSAGERDLSLLLEGLDRAPLRGQIALELGCGVGRLLRAAAKIFRSVIGVDVSPEAITRARALLADVSNVELMRTSGMDFSPVGAGSIDFAYSFATLGIMPVQAAAAAFVELNRVMRTDGIARLQVYLGSPQETFREDTLAIRTYNHESFERAMQSAGFEVRSTSEVVLPYEVSDHARGVVAKLVTLRRTTRAEASADEVARLLVPAGEREAGRTWSGSRTEYLMALARAQQHIDAGDCTGAEEALAFAMANYGADKSEIAELALKLRKISARGTVRETTAARPEARSDLFEANVAVLRDRFPKAAEHVLAATLSSDVRFEANGVTYRGTPLAHPHKPERAGEAWAQQVLRTIRTQEAASIAVAGFGLGYHLEALTEQSTKPVHVLEPSAEALRAALSVRDCRSILGRISSFTILNNTAPAMDRLSFNPAQTELVLYPQAQATHGRLLAEIRRLMIGERGMADLKPSVAVVGPMYGGSLPIAGYVQRALGNMKQRVTGCDLSPHYQSFTGIGTILRHPHRKGGIENRFVEMLSHLVVEAVAERSIDIVIALAQAPLTPAALTELRKRGVITAMWFVEDCRRFDTWKVLAPYYDYMFLIQQGEVPVLVEAAGSRRAVYLPVGASPSVHRPIPLSEEERTKWGSQLSFVGAGYHNRRHVFANLANRDLKIWGTEWPAQQPFPRLVQQGGARISPEDYVKIFNASVINLNLHSSMERDGVEPFGDFVNPRTFELAACGAFQLVDNRIELPANFDIGREVAVFSDTLELQQQIDYYLHHPSERAEIAEAGGLRALRDHTYVNRVRTMLSYIYADRYDQLRARERAHPWQRALTAAASEPDLEERLRRAFDRGDDPTLDSIVSDISTGKGSLTFVEQKLLFLHHLQDQVNYVRHLRRE